MATEITDTFVSERLRSIRRAQSLSLNDVEIASNGAIKAVVLGSYERGSRSLSVKRAIQIAHFYGVPVSTLFGASLALEIGAKSRVIIDTRRLRAMTEVETARDEIALQMVLRYISHIQSSREDWNGEVISLRERDIEHVAICLGYTPTTLIDWLESQKLLLSVRS
jgi:transcriptional regulator with XRE-family HTH domain